MMEGCVCVEILKFIFGGWGKRSMLCYYETLQNIYRIGLS